MHFVQFSYRLACDLMLNLLTFNVKPLDLFTASPGACTVCRDKKNPVCTDLINNVKSLICDRKNLKWNIETFAV